MAKAKKRNQRLADGWSGFRGRLAYAVDQRKTEDPGLTQNAIAEAAGIDSGQMTKILNGERARGVAANTVLLLAEALRVRPVWLMTGEEPSGLGRVTEADATTTEGARLQSSAPPPAEDQDAQRAAGS